MRQNNQQLLELKRVQKKPNKEQQKKKQAYVSLWFF